MQVTRVILRAALEAALWLVAPAAFLFVYVNHYAASADAVLPHLQLVGLMFAAFALARISLAALLRRPSTQRLATAVVGATVLLTMLLYYATVLISLEFWGRVISWPLITSYSARLPELAETLGVSLLLPAAALALAYIALLAVAWIYAGRVDWVPDAARATPGSILAVGVPAGFAIVAIALYGFLAAPPTQRHEPVSLTLFPQDGAWTFQGHAINPLSAARLDRLEDAARASYTPSPGANRKNVVVIVSDALRPDHMGAYGYARDTTPNLSRLVRAGAVRKAPTIHAVCSSSSCGLIGLASSKFVHEFHTRPFSLPEVLRRHGYRVHLVLGGDHNNFYGLKLSYGKADSYFDGSQAGASMNDDRALVDHLAEFPDWDGVPAMFQFHLMSTHVLGKRDPAIVPFSPAATYIRPEGRDRESGRGVNFYDNGVARADAVIHELLQILERKKYLLDAIVAITADHGEALGEHGLYLHGNSVREAALRIPFLLVSYGHRPDRPIDGHAFASQVDIAPTILAELGMPQPATWSGVPLQAAGARDFTYFQERGDAGLVDHRDPRNIWKYWVNSGTRREYAFNLSHDPHEETNAIERVPSDRLREWRRRALVGARVESGREADAP
jgi:glucan phosphoethanolaminetransferase (alkaline phosphatase superfamily)